MSSIKQLQDRALTVAAHYDDLNRAKNRKPWEPGDYMDGLVGDIGDLTKLTMALRGRRDIEDVCLKVEHELNDVLWSVLVLYKQLQIDPEQSFAKAMDQLEARVVGLKAELRSAA